MTVIGYAVLCLASRNEKTLRRRGLRCSGTKLKINRKSGRKSEGATAWPSSVTQCFVVQQGMRSHCVGADSDAVAHEQWHTT